MISKEFRVVMENGDHNYVTLTYSELDPWAIHMAFGEGNNWVFSRDLLLEGLNDLAGDGDVKIWPGKLPSARFVHMRLESPDGECELRFVRRLLVQFAEETRELVTPGLEYMDMNEVISAIFEKENR